MSAGQENLFLQVFKEWQILSHRDIEYFKTACSNWRNSFWPRFLNLGPADLSAWMIHYCGAVLCVRGCIGASLTSPPPQMPGVPSPQSWQPKMSPDITKCPLWARLSPAEKHSFWLTVRQNPLFPYLFPLPTSLQTLAISFFPSCLPLSYSFLLKPSLEGLIYIILQSIT